MKHLSFLLLYSIPSSKACGPFRNYNTSWEVVPDTILQFPTGLQQVLFGMASEAFAVPFFVILWWVLWRLDSLMQLHFLAYWTHTKHLLDFPFAVKSIKPHMNPQPLCLCQCAHTHQLCSISSCTSHIQVSFSKMLTVNPLQISTVSPVITIPIHKPSSEKINKTPKTVIP